MRLECRGLCKTYHVGTRTVEALADVSFSAESGSFVSIVGPSGCGKTTLLKLVAGLLKPTSGEVSAGDSSPVPAARGAVRSAMVFQEHGLFPWMRVVDNVAFGLEARGVGVTARRSAARHWLDRMGMGAFAHAYPHELSGGMRQRVALSRAFLTEAPLLLMDEPLGALDAQMRVLLQAEVLQQWAVRKQTVLYVTHDIGEALLLGDRVLVMSSRPGRILASHVTPLGRPRAVQDLDRPELVKLRWLIWESIEAEVRQSMGGA